MKKLIGTIFLILTPILAILPLLPAGYFSMHDEQHIVRLFLLNKGLQQGYFYPRWVDGLGFGFGYPLFNFYPPLIYYVAELFVLLGFSLIVSIKLMLIAGFIVAAIGAYLYGRTVFNRSVGLAAAALYSYSLYHATLVYVRGAFAEFWAVAILPFVFYYLHGLVKKADFRKLLGLGVSFGLLILAHPLIAFPAVFFVGFYFFFAGIFAKEQFKTWLCMSLGLLWGLALSAFFWLPSLLEKQFSLVTEILTKELYDYRLHYVYPSQLYYSPWGFGGSTEGTADGMSFQIGKYYLLILGISLGLSLVYLIRRQDKVFWPNFGLMLIAMLFSYFLTLPFSAFIWDRVQYLWYLQFPWRFLTFASLFLSLVGGSVFYILSKLGQKWASLFLVALVIVLVLRYSLLFKPQRRLAVTDRQLTSAAQIQWVISKTSFEFVPKGVATTKNDFKVTTLDIKQSELPKQNYRILHGQVQVEPVINRFQKKEFMVQARTPALFQLNTYDYPGWQAYLNGDWIKINHRNRLQLIRVSLPVGSNRLTFVFQNTPVRHWANYISLASFLLLAFLILKKVGIRLIAKARVFLD